MSGLNKDIAPMAADELKRYMPDLVEVVRCKDCTWFDSPRVCLRHGRFVENSNWFCADGERRDDADCTTCAEYDAEKGYCPKYCEVIRRTLEDITTIAEQYEFVKVVRCGKCRYYQGNHDVPGCAPCAFWGIGAVMWNDYCKRGERWEDDSN